MSRIDGIFFPRRSQTFRLVIHRRLRFSLSRALSLSLSRRVDGIKRCSLVDRINRRRCRCTRRISPSPRRNQAESIADLSTTPRLCLSPRRHLVSLPLLDENPSLSLFSTIPCMSPSPRRRRVSISLRLSSNQKVIICSYVLLSCMSLIRLLLVLISCLICFVGLILSRGGSLRRRRSSLRWLSSDQKVKLLFHVFE